MNDDITATRVKDPLAAPGVSSGRARAGIIVGVVIAVLAVVIGTLFATKTWPFSGTVEETVELVSSDGTRVRVQAQVIPGSLRIIAAPEILTSTTWKPLTPPVRFEAEGMEGTFRVTFEPGPTWRGRDRGSDDLEIVCVSQTAGTTPTGSEVLPDGSIATETTCETVTVGEPDEQSLEEQVSGPLDTPANPKDPLAAALLAGHSVDPTCTTDEILVGKTGANDTDPLCVEYLADRGKYRVAYVNWDATPYVFTLRDKVTRTIDPAATPGPGTPTGGPQNPLVAFLQGDRGSRAALVPRTGGLEAEYPPEAASKSEGMVGHPDVAGWILYGLRENLFATAGLNSNKKRMAQAVSLVDEAVSSDPVTQCATKAAAPLGDASTVDDTAAAVRSGYAACLPTAVTTLASTYAQFNGGNTERIANRINSVMTSEDQQAQRAEDSFRRLLMSASEETKGSDPVTRTLPTPRFMTKDEVFAMPVIPAREVDDFQSRCPAPPDAGAYRPIGVAPEAECLYVMAADVDGNGHPDRALTWTSGRPGGVGGGPRAPLNGRQGAVAYLDDGRIATLPARAAETEVLSDFELLSVDYIANDRRGYMAVEFKLGGHTAWLAFVGLGSDGNLNFVTDESGSIFSLALDGAARSAGGYGCYSREGRGRLADWDWSASGPAESDFTRIAGDLTVTPLEINDLVAKRVGDDLNYATPGNPATIETPVGRPCQQPDPAQRGAYVVNVPGALTRAERESQVKAAAQRALNAITSGDVGAIRAAFAPEAQPRAIAMARTVAGRSSLGKGLTCNWASVTNDLGLAEEVSCNATFDVEEAWLDVSLGRGPDGNYRGVNTDFWAD